MSECGSAGMTSKFSCAKCGSWEIVPEDQESYPVDDEEGPLCEHCNEDLIARNLAKEIMHHELLIKRDDDDDEEGPGADVVVKMEDQVDEDEEEDDERMEDGDGVTDEEEDDIKVEDEDEDEDKDEEEDASEDEDEEDGHAVRRSSRSTMNKYKNPELEPTESAEAGRRAKFLKTPPVYKSPNSQMTCVTSAYVFHRGVYYQLGDIVAINDVRGRGIFYAQITGFLTDQYCDKKATIQWLLPTVESPDHNVAFDPRTYYLGYIEDVPRPLEHMVPVMHAPSDYYRFNADPYPPVVPPPHVAKYVWHNLERVYIRRTDGI